MLLIEHAVAGHPIGFKFFFYIITYFFIKVKYILWEFGPDRQRQKIHDKIAYGGPGRLYGSIAAIYGWYAVAALSFGKKKKI